MSGDSITIGNVEVTAITDTVIEADPKRFFPAVPVEAWDVHKGRWPTSFSSDGSSLRFHIGSYAIRSDGRTLLVDTGIGPGPIRAAGDAPGMLVENLRANGIEPEGVDQVVHTHLHRDHCGWNVAHGQGAPRPTFSNARYVTQQADWDFFTREENLANFPYIEPQVLSLHDMGRLDLMSGEGALTSELTALPTRGHTPGHVSVLISSAGEHAVLLGDIAHHPAQYTEDSWNSFIDVEPEFSLETRRDMLRRIEADGLVMIAGHFPHPGFGQLVRVEGRRYWRAL